IEALLSADAKASSFLQRRNELDAMPLESGCSVGAYRILGLIGQGGMGEVYRARDTRLEREVAIKILPRLMLKSNGGQVPDNRSPLAPSDMEAAVKDREVRISSRFEREALLTASVQHPAVVPIYERGELPDGRPFYAMKLVSGRSLRELIDERKSLADRMALLPNVIAVAEALAHAHWQRVVHRDVKPSNVVVGEFGETILIDWGLAKSLAKDTEQAPLATTHSVSERTSMGEIIGTPAYMSPEQAKGLPVDERSDVFALGAMLYHVLAGRPPYEGDTATILPEVKQGHYALLSEKQPEGPD